MKPYASPLLSLIPKADPFEENIRVITIGGWPASPSSYIAFQIGRPTSVASPRDLAAWLPTCAPAQGDCFFGVDRSADRVKLSGLRFSLCGMSTLEQLHYTALAGFEKGAIFDTFALPPSAYGNLCLELKSRGELAYEKRRGEPCMIMVDIPDGSVLPMKRVVCDNELGYVNVGDDPANDMPELAFALQLDTWGLADGPDGSVVMCYAPGLNASMTL